jgi:LysM repeat protein
MAFRSPARWLAPLAILGAAAAILLTVSSSHGGSSSSGGGSSSTPTATGGHTTSTSSGHTSTTKGHTSRYYVVRPGDVLSAIADATNVPLTRIERLNPGVDAQSLHAGQKIKLVP